MARSRKISTDISIERKLNRVSEFAALLYTWSVPHARDDCRLPKQDHEELRLLIFPGRSNRTARDIEAAFEELIAERLMGVDEEGFYFFPADVFYKYNTYVGKANRRETPKLNEINNAGNQRKCAENSGDQRETPGISGNVRESAEKCASLSLSLSPSPSGGNTSVLPSRARAELVIDNDLGLGEKHPATLCGWELWRRLETFWRSEGKRLGIFQVEMTGKQLRDMQHKGHDPTEIVERALRGGWMDLYPPDDDPEKAGGPTVSFEDIRKRAAERARSGKT